MLKTTQLKYAIERIDRLASVKTKQINNERSASSLSRTEKEKLARSGKVKFTKAEFGGRYDSWENIFDFSEYEADDEAFDSRLASLNDEVARIKDQLVLGDAEEALSLIEAFAATEV